MYNVDGQDKVVELKDLPQSSVGAPCPMILAGEHHVHIAYFLQSRPQDWDGKSARVVGEDSDGEPVALVELTGCYAHMFGPPNDEAFGGHPLAARGLRPYGVFEVLNSSWIRRLERMNAVHPCHRPESFACYRHLIFSFHDTTFECVAEGFTLTAHSGSLVGVLGSVLREVH